MFHNLSKNVFVQMVQPPIADLTSAAVVPASGSFIDVSQYDYFAFVLMVGATDRTAQKIQIQQATAVDGTPKDILGAVNTALGASDDNKMVMVSCRTAALDTENGYRYVTALPTWTGGTAGCGAILFLGWRARDLPVSTTNSFAEVVTV